MKALVIIIGIVILGFGAVQYFTMSNTNQTEIQEYKVVSKDGNFEVRYYPTSIIASVSKPGDIDAIRSAGFRDLAGYIFGGNEKNQSIAMTSPVIMEEQESGTKMSFVMPKEYKREDLPLPNNSSVSFSETTPVHMAVLRFGGYADKNKIAKKEQILQEWLQKEGLKISSKFSFMAYNPPYQLINRRNEVAVELMDY